MWLKWNECEKECEISKVTGGKSFYIFVSTFVLTMSDIRKLLNFKA